MRMPQNPYKITLFMGFANTKRSDKAERFGKAKPLFALVYVVDNTVLLRFVSHHEVVALNVLLDL